MDLSNFRTSMVRRLLGTKLTARKSKRFSLILPRTSTVIRQKSSPEQVPVHHLFVCVGILPPSQPNGVMSSAVSLPNHTFTGQA